MIARKAISFKTPSKEEIVEIFKRLLVAILLFVFAFFLYAVQWVGFHGYPDFHLRSFEDWILFILVICSSLFGLFFFVPFL